MIVNFNSHNFNKIIWVYDGDVHSWMFDDIYAGKQLVKKGNIEDNWTKMDSIHNL